MLRHYHPPIAPSFFDVRIIDPFGLSIPAIDPAGVSR
jgi:hypothetical protein